MKQVKPDIVFMLAQRISNDKDSLILQDKFFLVRIPCATKYRRRNTKKSAAFVKSTVLRFIVKESSLSIR